MSTPYFPPEEGEHSGAQAAADRALIQTLLINVAIATIALLLFFFLRRRLKYIYQPLYARNQNIAGNYCAFVLPNNDL